MADEHPSGTSAALELALEELEAEVAAMNRAGAAAFACFLGDAGLPDDRVRWKESGCVPEVYNVYCDESCQETKVAQGIRGL